MKPFLAIGLGEILWDLLPDGRKLGGAPANFAYHVNELGGVGIPVSRVGDDSLGREALEQLARHSLNVDFISIDRSHPTGSVDVFVDEHGVATYSFPDNVAWDFLAFEKSIFDLAAKADAICFGSLAQRTDFSRSSIHAFLAAAPSALKIYDINLRQNFYSLEIIESSMILADVLKINDDELALISDMFSLPSDEHAALSALVDKYSLKFAVLTRGSQGSLILSPAETSDFSGCSTTVIDTIGAGDSFTAAMALAFLHGQSFDQINRYASNVAAYVCSHAGAMPKIPEHLQIGVESGGTE